MRTIKIRALGRKASTRLENILAFEGTQKALDFLALRYNICVPSFRIDLKHIKKRERKENLEKGKVYGAIYDPNSRTIIFRDGVKALDLIILTHEFIHHVQYIRAKEVFDEITAREYWAEEGVEYNNSPLEIQAERIAQLVWVRA